MMKGSPFILVIVLLVIACTPRVPSKYIQPEEMEQILYDYHLVQAMAKNDREGDGKESELNRSKYFYAVLNKHKVSPADFDSSMVYYYSHLDRLKKIYTEVNLRLSDEAKALGASVTEVGKYSHYSASGDTANIWTGATNLLLIPRPTMNRYDFSVKVDTAFRKGDSFLFQFMTEYLYQGGVKDAVVCILTKYEGDSITQTVNHVSVSGISQIRVPANRENKLKEMSGFIYLGSGNGQDENLRKMMFISELQLIRFHNKELPAPSAATKTDTFSVKSIADTLERSPLKLDSTKRLHPGPRVQKADMLRKEKVRVHAPLSHHE